MNATEVAQISKNVLVVCLGNICRSPVGEYLLRYYCQNSENSKIQKIHVDSAGISPVFNQMSANSARYLQNFGLDPSTFRSKRISAELLKKQDLVLVMEESQKEEIISELVLNGNPNSNLIEKPEIMTLAEAAGYSGDVEDPYGDSWEGYRKVLDQIHLYVKAIKEKWEKKVPK